MISFKKNSASYEEVTRYITECDFSPPIESYVNVKDYINKLLSKAERYEAWNKNRLVGLIAIYLNNYKLNESFISHLGVVNEYLRQGIATSLMNLVIDESRKKLFYKISLEANLHNKRAIMFYKKFNFKEQNINKDKIYFSLVL